MMLLARVHGLYYLLTGLWPVFHIDSFQSVTGAKTDLWLVKTVGLLIAVIGATLLAAGRRKILSTDLVLLGAGSAAALGGIDVTYALRGVISKIYLLDAPIEAALASAWVGLWIKASSPSEPRA